MAPNEHLFAGADCFPEEVSTIYRSLFLQTGDLKTEEFNAAVVGAATEDPKQPSGLHGFFGGAYTRDGEFITSSTATRGDGVPFVYQNPDAPHPGNPDMMVGDALFAGPLIYHYGHFLMESTARLWPVLFRKFDYIVYQLPSSLSPVLVEFQAEFFKLLGIFDKIVIVGAEPRPFSRLFIPEPSVVLASHIHRLHRELFLAAAKAHLGNFPLARGKPIYVSRKIANEGVICGEEHIQREFEASGYQSVYTENLNIYEKIILFSEAPAVAGFLGSGLHNILFSLREQDVIILVRYYQSLHSYFLIDMSIGRSSIYVDCVDDRLSADFPPFHASGPFLVPVRRSLMKLESMKVISPAAIQDNVESMAAQRYVVEWQKLRNR